ncbi:sensor histidine kinase [Streptomyces chryseus]|uniref:sensor histidine kinase n=1 Tax=Streptomyces chryseus TaxID=68186 RepID=UPI00167503CA|nr:histidine kinase [Streptomyces chryseus]GGX39379.1 two-component sensor histidine kinase [Streptomyces chryseus]
MTSAINGFVRLVGRIPPSQRPRRPRHWPLIAFLLWGALNLPVVLLPPASADDGYLRWQPLVGAVVLAVAVAVHRALPLVSFFLCVALWWTVGVLHNDVGSIVVSPYLPAVFIASFTVGKLPMSPQSVLCAVGLVALGGSAATVFVGLTLPMWFVLVTALLFACLLPWLVGRYSRQRNELQHSGWEHARQLELQQRISVEQARLRERTRIAEDMHDSLGHELSLIALRAGALQVAPTIDDRFRDEAGELRANAANALERLRDIIGVLREDDAPARMDPSQADINDLVERARTSGMLVELEHTGEIGQLQEMTEKALYRVVQESLTNAMKHAPRAQVAVRLAHTPADVTVTVRNGPSPEPASPDRPQGRRGLIGLEERTRLAGGEFHAAARYDGGFEVTARLPRTSAVIRAAGNYPPVGRLAESADGGLAHATIRLRRRFITAVSLPLGLFACLAVGMLGYYAYLSNSSSLAPQYYDQLKIGDSAAKAELLLPDNEMSDPPSEYRPEPAGATCRYYRASEALFVRVDVHRLCFADGRLVTKDVITAESRAPVDHD